MVCRPLPGLAVALALSLPVLASASTVGPLIELSASPPGASQRAPALAYDPGQAMYVIVFEDDRGSADDGFDLILARLDGGLTLLDPMGLHVVGQTDLRRGDQTRASIAYVPGALSLFLAWNDPRDGVPGEVYGTRFLAASAVFPASAGVRLTQNTEAEGAPATACGAGGCAVVFPTGQGVKVVRVDTIGDPIDGGSVDLLANDTGATSELGPSVVATGASFAVGLEDDRARATGLLGAELYGRTFPDFGSIAPVTGTLLVSADYRQSSPAFAELVPGELFLAWQDQRAGTGTATLDLYGRRFSGALAGLDAERPISLAPGHQQGPRVAAGTGRGLVVWQDFRHGPNAHVYAARVDSTGAVLDPDGFSVLSANANLFEQAVVKGPGDDYLVVGVRAGAVPKILLRVVRDEVPAGVLPATGPSAVRADGVTEAEVCFGPATGASGFQVVDGTRFDLDLGGADAEVRPADQDPNRPGHQLAAAGARVCAALRSLRPATVSVSLSSVEGTATGTFPITFENVPPVATNVRVAPESPRSSDDLSVAYTYSDVNGDPDRGTQIAWTRNQSEQPAHANQSRVPAGALSRGDVWRARVRPSDGRSFGDIVFSNEVTIGNSPPAVRDVRIDPAGPVKAGTRLAGRYRFFDPDTTDREVGTSLVWRDRGQVVEALRDLAEVPATATQKGQVWTFEVTPSDGFDAGLSVRSASVAVVNTAPVADAGRSGSALERREVVLDGSASSDLDLDPLSFTWRQIEGPAVTLSSLRTATVGFTAPSVTATVLLAFELEVGDGEERSRPARVNVLVEPVADGDADGLDDEEELVHRTDPQKGDTDRDGLLDGAEIAAGADPNDADSDDDGLRDGDEENPSEDEDMDQFPNVMDFDADGDGLPDGLEAGVREAPAGTDLAAGRFVADADPDTTTDALAADTDGDGLADGVEDANRNGRVDPGESDPSDRESTAGCAGGEACPNAGACVNGTCRAPVMADAGLTCTRLADRDVECCAGGCAGGTFVEPVCRTGGALEECPGGARQCAAGSCSSTVEPPAESGCGCQGAGGAGPEGLLALLALVAIRRRRG